MEARVPPEDPLPASSLAGLLILGAVAARVAALTVTATPGEKVESAEAKKTPMEALLDYLEPLQRGENATESERRQVRRLLDDLPPPENPGGIEGKWTLLYSDAPDIT